MPPVAEAPDVDTMAALYPRDNGEEINITPLAQSILREYDEAKQAEGEAKKRREQAEARLKQMIGEHETAWVGERRITWRSVTTSRFDAKAFREAHPDLYEEFLSSSSYRRFVVS